VSQFSNYTDLQASVLAYNWSRDTDQVADAIYLAHQAINAKLRIPAMEKSDTLTVNATSVTTPSDLLAVKKLWIDGSFDSPLSPVPPDRLQALAAAWTTAQPQWYAIEGYDDTTDVFRFAPDPGATSYTAYLTYYRRMDFFASGAATNKILARYPQLYLYGALVELARFSDDDARVAKYEPAFERMMAEVNMQARSDALGGGAMAPQSPYTV